LSNIGSVLHTWLDMIERVLNRAGLPGVSGAYLVDPRETKIQNLHLVRDCSFEAEELDTWVCR
jgi:hypothetical protein